ncbi:hypothetical protein I3760_10G137600 [Carya illinoinensis]|nr:hypothetical protein I3760_10G137600 [Carya illinoinensis]
MALFLLINGAAASWVVKMVVEAAETRWRENFFKKMRIGNGFLTLHLLRNARGCYLHLEEFVNGRRRGSLIIPEGTKSCGWEGFAYNLKKVAEHEALSWVGEFGFRPLATPASYAAALSGATGECSAVQELQEDKSGCCPVVVEGISDSGTTLGEIEGVFWDVKSKLSGVLQEIATLVNKVDMGLGMVMGRSKVRTSVSLQPISEGCFPIMGGKASACAEITEGCGALVSTRPLGPLFASGPNGPQSPQRAKYVLNPHQAGSPIRASRPVHPPGSQQAPSTRASTPLTRALSPSPRPAPQTGSPSRVEPVTRKDPSTHGSRSRDPLSGSLNQTPPAIKPATPSASQKVPTSFGNPTGVVKASPKPTKVASTPPTELPTEENDVTVDPLASVGPNPAQKLPICPLEATGFTSEGHFSSGNEDHSSPAVRFAPSLMDSSEFTSRVLCTLEEEVELGFEVGEEGEADLGSSLLVPFTDMGIEGDVVGNEGDDPSPLCSLPPALPWSDPQTDWVLKKVEDIRHCARISCVGFEDQLTALFTAIVAEQSHHLRSASKRERELKRLSCSVNYDREGSASRERITDRVTLGDP